MTAEQIEKVARTSKMWQNIRFVTTEDGLEVFFADVRWTNKNGVL